MSSGVCVCVHTTKETLLGNGCFLFWQVCMSPQMPPTNKYTCLRKHFTSTACCVEKLNDREEAWFSAWRSQVKPTGGKEKNSLIPECNWPKKKKEINHSLAQFSMYSEKVEWVYWCSGSLSHISSNDLNHICATLLITMLKYDLWSRESCLPARSNSKKTHNVILHHHPPVFFISSSACSLHFLGNVWETYLLRSVEQMSVAENKAKTEGKAQKESKMLSCVWSCQLWGSFAPSYRMELLHICFTVIQTSEACCCCW